MREDKSRLGELVSSLKQQRDELKLKMHLGSTEAKEEWEKLEDKLQQLSSDYEPMKHAVDEWAEDVWESLKLVAGEIKAGFNRIRESL